MERLLSFRAPTSSSSGSESQMVVWFVWDVSRGWHRVEGRMMESIHGQKLEVHGNWNYLKFLFYFPSIWRRLVLPLSPTRHTSLCMLGSRSALATTQLTMLFEGCLPLQTLVKIMFHTRNSVPLNKGD